MFTVFKVGNEGIELSGSNERLYSNCCEEPEVEFIL